MLPLRSKAARSRVGGLLLDDAACANAASPALVLLADTGGDGLGATVAGEASHAEPLSTMAPTTVMPAQRNGAMPVLDAVMRGMVAPAQIRMLTGANRSSRKRLAASVTHTGDAVAQYRMSIYETKYDGQKRADKATTPQKVLAEFGPGSCAASATRRQAIFTHTKWYSLGAHQGR